MNSRRSNQSLRSQYWDRRHDRWRIHQSIVYSQTPIVYIFVRDFGWRLEVVTRTLSGGVGIWQRVTIIVWLLSVIVSPIMYTKYTDDSSIVSLYTSDQNRTEQNRESEVLRLFNCQPKRTVCVIIVFILKMQKIPGRRRCSETLSAIQSILNLTSVKVNKVPF